MPAAATARVRFLPEDVCVDVPVGTRLLDAALLAGIRVSAPCGGRGRCGKCLLEIRDAGNGAWRLVSACQTAVGNDLAVRVPVGASETQVLLSDQRPAMIELDPVLPRAPEDLDAAHPAAVAAVDIGTTTLAATLLSPFSGEALARAGMQNPQAGYGADVISRLAWAQSHGSEELTRCLRRAVDGLIHRLCRNAGIPADRVFAVMIAGNTAMHHLYLGLDTDSLGRAPYRPACLNAIDATASEYGLHLHPDARLYALPVIGGFVGADTVACMIDGDWAARDRVTLLVDVGTNGEMVLGSRERRLCCSAAAGPAFEGARIQCGMAGSEGAVDRVWLEDGQLRWHAIGSAAARGICGSGLIDFVAVLLRMGEIDETGLLRGGTFCLPGTDIFLTQQDIREVQLAKAAISTGILMLCDQMNTPLEAIDEVCLAGAFGTHIDPRSACAIGMIPAVLEPKIRAVGNAACAGVERALLTRSVWESSEALARGTGVLELASLKAFQDVFVDQLAFSEAEA